MIRRPLAALATAVSALAVVALPSGPANAEGVCTLTPPARIAIYQDDTLIPANISGDCVPAGYGLWFTPGGDDEEDTNYASAVFFADEQDPIIDVPDVLQRYGLQEWGAGGALNDIDCDFEDSLTGKAAQATKGFASTETDGSSSQKRAQVACEDLTQNEPYSDIRLGTYAAIAGTRNSASKVTFTVTSAIWSTGLDKLINRSMKGELQTQYADGTWHKVGNSIATGTNGKATFAVSLPVRTWRFAVYSTPYSFDRASTPITR